MMAKPCERCRRIRYQLTLIFGSLIIVNFMVRLFLGLDTKAINDLLREGWVLKRLDITLRAIMRAGTFELMFCKDIPVKVCIAEYTSMANAYFNAPEAGMANAIFEKIANTSRS